MTSTLNGSISGQFIKIATQYGERVAIDGLDAKLSYSELHVRSEVIANHLIKNLGPHKEHIAVAIEDVMLYHIAILGVLKAGKSYVPIDLAAPSERNQHILSDIDVRWLLRDKVDTTLAFLSGLQTEVVDIEILLATSIGPQASRDVLPTDPALVIYTSGSTGLPKGVVQSHQTVMHNCLMQTKVYGITSQDRFSQFHSPSVMGAVRATYNAFLNGATLCPFDVKTHGFIALRNWLASTNLTVFHSSSSLFRGFVAAVQDSKIFIGVRLLILGGEPSTRSDLELFRQYFPDDALFCTGLGSTETCTVRMLLLAKEDLPETLHDILPLGYPVEGADIKLLGDDGREVMKGELGEIEVTSHYLSLGYWNKDRHAIDLFPQNITGQAVYRMGDIAIMRDDGCLQHMGRKDHQLKIRGNRIEIREIEVALDKIEGVNSVAVKAWKEADQEPRLAAYIVPSTRSLTTEQLKLGIENALPSYMIPTYWIFVQEIPRTLTGKVDYAALLPIHQHDVMSDMGANLDSSIANQVCSDNERDVRELIADCLEYANVITFTRRNLRNVFISNSQEILLSNLDIDSLAMMEFCIALEDKAGVTLNSDDMQIIASLNELVEILLEKRS